LIGFHQALNTSDEPVVTRGGILNIEELGWESSEIMDCAGVAADSDGSAGYKPMCRDREYGARFGHRGGNAPPTLCEVILLHSIHRIAMAEKHRRHRTAHLKDLRLLGMALTHYAFVSRRVSALCVPGYRPLGRIGGMLLAIAGSEPIVRRLVSAGADSLVMSH